MHAGHYHINAATAGQCTQDIITPMQQLQVNARRTLSHQCSYCKFTTCRTHIALEGIDDELEVLGVDTLNAFLYNMVPVLVFHALQDVALQFLHHLHL